MRHRFSISILAWAVTYSVCSAQTQPPDEKTLWFLWKHHLDRPDDHAGLAAECEEFRKKAPHDPFVVVSQGIEAWHLLKIGRTDSAALILERMISATVPHHGTADVLYETGSNMARRWLTRIDREHVKRALQEFYVDAIEYPGSLNAIKSLAKEKQPPMTDRWGKPWSYRLVDFKHLKGIHGQKYELLCTMLGRNSDLSQSLDVSYASRINLKPVKLTSSARGKKTVQFTSTGEKQKDVYLSVGTEASSITFVYLGSKILILTDGDHWMVLPKPK